MVIVGVFCIFLMVGRLVVGLMVLFVVLGKGMVMMLMIKIRELFFMMLVCGVLFWEL